MVFESFSPAVGVSFSYQAYVGLSMKADNTESGLSGVAPYGFYRLNSLQASNFLGVCQQCLSFDLSTNQRIIIEKCMEECKRVIDENSVKYWKEKWVEEKEKTTSLQESLYLCKDETDCLKREIEVLKVQLVKAQKKIMHLKRNLV